MKRLALPRRRAQASTEAIIIIALCAVILLLVVAVFGNDIKDIFFGTSDSMRAGKAKDIRYDDQAHARSDTKHDSSRLGGGAEGSKGGAGGGDSGAGGSTGGTAGGGDASGGDGTAGSGAGDKAGSPAGGGGDSGLSGAGSDATWKDKLIHRGLQEVLGTPTDGESTYIKLEGNGGLSIPGIEFGIPGSIGAGVDGEVTLQQNSDGTIELTYGAGGRAGIEESVGAAEIEITAGGKQYGVGAEAGVGGGVLGKGSVTFKFDPKKEGDMELLLETLGGPGTAGPKLIDHVEKIGGSKGVYLEGEADAALGIELFKAGVHEEFTHGVEYSKNPDGTWTRSESIKGEVQGDVTFPYPDDDEFTANHGGSAMVEVKIVTDDKIKSPGDLATAGGGPAKEIEITAEMGTTEDGWLYGEGHKEKVTYKIKDPAVIAEMMPEIVAMGADPSVETTKRVTEKLKEQIKAGKIEVSREEEDTQTSGLGISGEIGGLTQEVSGTLGISGTRGTIKKKK